LIADYAVSYAYDGRNDRTSTFYPLGQRCGAQKFRP